MATKTIFKIPSLKLSQPLGEFFVSVMKASDLNEIAWADVRRMNHEKGEIDNYLGIQRTINPERIKEIKEYVKHSSEATFPTSIIVAVPQECAYWDESSNCLVVQEYTDGKDADRSVTKENIAKILDGQHRLRGLKEAQEEFHGLSDDENNLDNFYLNVSFFVGADIAQQANIFATVNLAQTKVNRSLVYDLAEYSKSRSPQKTSHYIAVALDKQEASPFFKSIKRLGTATPGRREEGHKETITQATFVDGILPHISGTTAKAIKDREFLMRHPGKKLAYPNEKEQRDMVFRTLFAEERDSDIAKIYWAYFKAVSERWSTAWGAPSDKGNIIKKTNGYRAFAKFFKHLYLFLCDRLSRSVGSFVSASEFGSILKEFDILDEDFNVENYAPGTSGEAKLLRDLRDELEAATTRSAHN